MEQVVTTVGDQAEYERLVELLRGGNITLLTGAGLSTESGIPDYRGPDGSRRVVPMTYGEFVGSPESRQRYWARSFMGWRRFAGATPNEGHRAVADLQGQGLVRAIITQNVDGLHQLAGAHDVLELHGNLALARCLHCGETTDRAELDVRLNEANPHFVEAARVEAARVEAARVEPARVEPARVEGARVEALHDVTVGEARPDGDVVLSEEAVATFHAPRCLVCESDLLKPDVVFFGEPVPKTLVEQSFSYVEASSGLVVLGSSLKVMSGYRFVRRAASHGIPVAIVTRGPSRGDDEATIRLDVPLGETLSRIVQDLKLPARGSDLPQNRRDLAQDAGVISVDR